MIFDQLMYFLVRSALSLFRFLLDSLEEAKRAPLF